MRSEHERKQRHTRSGVEPPLPEGVTPSASKKQAAREPTERALKIHQEIGDRNGEAASWVQLGRIELSLGNVEAAREPTERAPKICQEIGDRDGKAGSKQLLDELATRPDDSD